MISKRPSIYIYGYRPSHHILSEICSGIEEEGVFFQVIHRQEENVEELSYQAAQDSMLGSGIGIKEDEICFQIKGLPRGRYIFRYEKPSGEEARRLGANAARAVKKQPFKEEKR